MSLDRDLLDAVRDMDEHDLRRLQMLATAHLARGGAEAPPTLPRVSVRSQEVRCGKRGCTRCPHGPYWYAYWTEDGKRRSRYLGRLPEDGSLS